MFQSLLAALRGFVGSSWVAKNRSLFLLPVLAALYSSLASAVGLGEITVHSALNQPLEAEIALVQAQGLEEGELSVSLATAGEFKQAGIERLPFLEDLRFTQVLQGERRVIRVVSSKPVNEPFLDFLLQVNQANGRQLREYTLLIDPPGSPEIVPAPLREVAKPEPAIATQAPSTAVKVSDPAAGQLAQALQANQQLQDQAQELRNTLQQRDEQLARQQQQLVELQRQLAETRSKPADSPAPVHAPATPTAVSPPQPAEQAPETDEGSNPWLMLAALLLMALLVVLVVRRRRQSAAVPEAQMAPESRPTRTLASAVTTVAAQESFRSTPPVAPVQPVAGDRLTDREPSIDVDWDLIAPSEPSSAPPPPTAAPAPFNADSIVWRLEEPDEPGAGPQAEAESDTKPQNVWPKLR
ncbi:peptidoglycan-binding protein LysM [Pseudomonas sp. GW456-L14]|uniref:type IV pilus assembly protein FimV n=2 Tax=Pseudomonas TaxID=286 RepID=UPI000C88E87D|nr:MULTISPECIES: LPXTG cell wall anchor domain-containing protein [unclassified Pseudomonas]PMY40200.1 peptidoglycan-binding protein LysM [Pseudomonas sp. GW456-L14]PMY53479.1 peptidoglycan-binding protein LysM [Pseudomonas sp. GW456-L12]